MGFKIVQQIAFTAVVLIIGQIRIKDRTIGGYFVYGIKAAARWTYWEIKKAKLFVDSNELKTLVEEPKDRVRAVQADVASGVQKVESLAKTIEEKLQIAKKEASEQVQDIQNDEDENASQTISLDKDQKTLLKNLP